MDLFISFDRNRYHMGEKDAQQASKTHELLHANGKAECRPHILLQGLHMNFRVTV